MDRFQHILRELEAFQSRYYKRQILKGAFLFVFFSGVLVFLVSGLEYVLWMGTALRAVLFWAVVAVLLFLLVRFMVLPALKLWRWREGLSHKEGSRIIGKHFPEVGDRLLNLIELSESDSKSELLLASIQQRSEGLGQFPFREAAPWKEALRFGKYALVPVVLAILLWVSGLGIEWMQSYKRMVHYDVAYAPPAPFEFQLLNRELRVPEHQPLVLSVQTVGEVLPDRPEIVIDGEVMVMEQEGRFFTYTLRPPLRESSFYFRSGEVRSLEYRLEVFPVPAMEGFEMTLDFPAYLNRPSEIIKGTGNAVVPEGTNITWHIRAVHTDRMDFYTPSDSLSFEAHQSEFTLKQKIRTSVAYAIGASNADMRDFDRLEYQIRSIGDEYPDIRVVLERDTLNPNMAFFTGEIADDYGIASVYLEYYPVADPERKRRMAIPVTEDLFYRFYYTYPSGLNLIPGQRYALQFLVRDNDGLRGGKESKSPVFTLDVLTPEQLRALELKAQGSLIREMDKQLKEQQQGKADLEQWQQQTLEKRELEYNDRQALQQSLKRQQQQEQMMEKFSKALSEQLEQQEDDPFKELLQERLERQEQEARKNAALMEEIQKVLDELDKEVLQERLEDMSRSSQQNQRSLEQVLELTKRYFVEQKTRALQMALEQLAEKQLTAASDTAKGSDMRLEEQEKLSEEFDSLRVGLTDLEKANKALRKPTAFKRDASKEQEASEGQKKAEQAIENESEQGDTDTSTSRREQQNAGSKIQQLSDQMKTNAMSGGMESIAEDAQMLRQVLDNLVVFSFQQEQLFEQIQDNGQAELALSGNVKRQKELQRLFEHVDDSLFALSLRRPELGERVNQQISDVYYNIEKGLESLGEGQWYRGASYSQYVITAANELAALLAGILENMQQSLQMGQGAGAGSDGQLQDIIMSQQQLQQQGQGSSQGSSGQGGQGGSEGQEGREGEGEQQGSSQGEGNDGGTQEGNAGEKGNTGEDGEGAAKRDGDGGEEGGGNSGLEEQYGEWFEIYKEQQRIRLELEKQLEDLLREEDRKLGEQITRQMEQLEDQLLRNGITQQTAEQLNRIQQQLLRLENAALKQGEKEEREGRTSTQQFVNPIFTRPGDLENSQEEIELLRKQVLPLRRRYKSKVRHYFGATDSIPLRE